MADPPLNVDDDLPGIGLVPTPIQVFSDWTKLHRQIARQIRRLDLPALFPPKPKQGRFVVPHDNPGVGAADKMSAMTRLFPPYISGRPAEFCGCFRQFQYGRPQARRETVMSTSRMAIMRLWTTASECHRRARVGRNMQLPQCQRRTGGAFAVGAFYQQDYLIARAACLLLSPPR